MFWMLYVIALNGSAIPAEDSPMLRTQAQCEAAANKANKNLGHLAPELNGKLFICKAHLLTT